MKNEIKFKEMVEEWYYSKNKVHEDCYIRKTQYPYTRHYFDKYMDVDRYKTYCLTDVFEEKIDSILFPEEYEYPEISFMNDEESKEEQKDFIRMIEEVVEGKLGSFCCDW